NQGVRLLSTLLATTRDISNASSAFVPAQVGAIAVRWSEIRNRLNPSQAKFLTPVLETIAIAPEEADDMVTESGMVPSPQPPRKNWLAELETQEERDRPTFFITYLQQQIGQVLQLDPTQISVEQNLMELGMDSLMVMESINQLRQDFQLMLYPREFYEHSSISALAQYLAQEFAKEFAQEFTQDYTDDDISSTPDQLSITAPLIIPTLQGASDRVTLHQGKRLPNAVFILSSPRSGSTLLRVMLAGHSRLFATPELHLLPFDTMTERQQQLGDAHLSEGLERSLMELHQWDSSTSHAQVQQWLDQNLSIAEVYANLQASTAHRLLVDKSPTYAMHRPTLDRAESLFENAKYIHLVRHPYAVVESFVRMRMDKLLGIATTNPYELAERIWSQSNQNILDFAQTVDRDRYHQLRYEDLVRDPSAALSQLCEFLDIDLEPALLNPYDGDRMTDGVHDQSLSLGDPNFLLHQRIDPALADSWKTIDLPQALNDGTKAIAHQFDYEIKAEGRRQNLRQKAEGGRQKAEELAPKSKIQNLKSKIPYTEIALDLNGLTHTICTWGDENAPPIVCVHGVLDQGLIWAPVAQTLVQQGYRVIAPDLRGHGCSTHVGPGGTYHLLDFLADLDAILNHLDIKVEGRRQKAEGNDSPTPQLPNSLTPQPITLIGHSMGSIITALYASSRPQRVRSLFLIEPILPGEKHQSVTDQLTTLLESQTITPEQPVFPDVATAARRLRQGTPSLTEEFSLQLAQRICVPANPNSGDQSVRWTWDAKLRDRTGIGFRRMPFGRADYLQLLSQLGMDVTVVYGDRSTFNRPDDLVAQTEALAHAKRITLSGGHNIHLDASMELARLILNEIEG
ncbi:MAG: alpha/beta fold hydrolase, partial [Leptolyngbyaceae cyanobacterium]